MSEQNADSTPALDKLLATFGRLCDPAALSVDPDDQGT